MWRCPYYFSLLTDYVPDLLPLQFGETDTLFLVLVGIAFVGIVIAVIIFALRRSSAMSNELSMEAERKLEALKPAPGIQRIEPAPQGETTRQAALRAEARQQVTSPILTLMGDLQETKKQLQQSLRDLTALRERDATTRNEVESLKSDVHSLHERIFGYSQELQKLRMMIEEQNVKLQNQRRDIEIQRRELKEGVEGLERRIREAPKPPLEPTIQPPSQPLPQLVQPTAAREMIQQPPAPTLPPQEVPTPEVAQPPTQPVTRESGLSRIFGGLFTRRICSNCGRQLASRDRFCDQCGKPIPQI